ncbi:MAG: DUF2807 domain-containing protein [Chitinophagaceae bacterium]|nr:DUF2807 domain-containing protein [Chitinophagaceae bacterium]
MKKVIISGLALMLGAAGSLNAQTKDQFRYGLSEIKVAPFEKISISAKIDVVLVQSETYERVFIEGDEKQLDAITVSTVNGELVIAPSKNYSGSERLLVTIPYKNLKRIANNRDAKISADSAAGL